MPQSKAATLRAKTLYRDNDTSAQPQSERITIQGSHKSYAFVGKESNRLISDAFAERQIEPKGELRTPSQAMGAARQEKRRGEIPMECFCKAPSVLHYIYNVRH